MIIYIKVPFITHLVTKKNIDFYLAGDFDFKLTEFRVEPEILEIFSLEFKL